MFEAGIAQHILKEEEVPYNVAFDAKKRKRNL